MEEAIVLTMLDLSNHLVRRGEQMAATVGLTTQQWLVLLQIAGDPNFPSAPRRLSSHVLASDLARARGVTRPTISTVVRDLKRRGLIQETADADDGRRRHLVLTDAGAALLTVVQPMRVAANRRLLAGLEPADRARFLRYLEHCLGVLWDAYERDQTSAAQARVAVTGSRSSARRS